MDCKSDQTIGELTRRNIADALTIAIFSWSGRMSESEFLARLYNINDMPSHDPRYKTAAEDISKHMEMNRDWSHVWVFYDARFDLLHAPDETLLRFLCEMVHPAVQPDQEKVHWVLDMLNANLATDGWEIAPCREISGKSIFAARRRLEAASFSVNQAQRIADVLSGSYISQQITRMENSIGKDPELAIGTAKEFIETICKTVLVRCAVPLTGTEDMMKLVRHTLKQLKLTPDNIPKASESSDTIRVLLSSLSNITHKLAELRNIHGSGHGKDATTNSLGSRHARLAVGAASAFGVFIFETYESGQTGI